jgi:hypothetical protein
MLLDNLDAALSKIKARLVGSTRSPTKSRKPLVTTLMLMYQHSRSSVTRPGHINDGGKQTLQVLIDEPDRKHSFETVSSVSV